MLCACDAPLPPPTGAAVPLVSRGAEWSYWDLATPPPAGWHEAAFDDASWSRGRAELGYGDGDEVTLLRCRDGWPEATPCPEDEYGGRLLAAFFRRTFTVDDPAVFQRLRLHLLRDDGAVVYLNGDEVARANMPPGAIGHDTLAATRARREDSWVDYRLEPSLLAAGRNVLAVEVHQASPASSDLSFDLELSGFDPRRIALTRGPYLQQATPRSMVVRWRTRDATPSVVRWGPSPDRLERESRIEEPVTEHTVVLEPLEPSARVCYAVVAREISLAGGDVEHCFDTPPEVGSALDPLEPLRIWVLGDSGTGDRNARRVRDAFERWNNGRPLDFLLMLGDNAYEDGTDAEHQAGIFDMYPRSLRRAVLWPSLGNHDTRSANSTREDGPYFDAFDLPRDGEAGGTPSGTEAYYSFDHGDLHVIMLDSADSVIAPDARQVEWLRRDLAASDAAWTIAVVHHPPYSRGGHDSDWEGDSSGRLVAAREVLGPLFEAEGVDLVLSGHSHVYERTPLLAGHFGASDSFDPTRHVVDSGFVLNDFWSYSQDEGRGTLYVVAGSSGKLTHPQHPRGTLDHPAMAVAVRAMGSLLLEVGPRRIRGTFVDDAGTVRDRFALHRSPPDG
ncbi:MAG: metallophosphoesterase family protein [Acidobacteriota bacterium]